MRSRVANGASRHANATHAMNSVRVTTWRLQMQIEITQEEKQQLIACIEMAIKHAPNSLQTAALLIPLAKKLSEANDVSSS
jgi:hypothetical protein